jgi:hypothetical protein
MPTNGERNKIEGVYKTLCCGEEIVLKAGLRFPDCPNHLRLPTIWKPVTADQPRLTPKPTSKSVI